MKTRSSGQTAIIEKDKKETGPTLKRRRGNAELPCETPKKPKGNEFSLMNCEEKHIVESLKEALDKVGVPNNEISAGAKIKAGVNAKLFFGKYPTPNRDKIWHIYVDEELQPSTSVSCGNLPDKLGVIVIATEPGVEFNVSEEKTLLSSFMAFLTNRVINNQNDN